MVSLFNRLSIGFIMMASLWLAGLFVFAHAIPDAHDKTQDARYDAIIVLTGGESRIEYGMQLLEADVAPMLFITGVADGYSLNEARGHQLGAERVFYGEKARDTLGNAHETHAWLAAQDEQIKRLLIVTANYHMLRTELIFDHYLPAYQRDYASVSPSQFKRDNWLSHSNSLRLVMSEYHKTLLTWLKLSVLGA